MAEIYPRSESDLFPALSPYQALAAVRDLTNVIVHLRPLEEVAKVVIEDGRAAVAIRTASYTETTARYVVKKRGMRLIEFKRGPHWWVRTEDTFWTAENLDEVIHKFDNGIMTTREAIEKQQWERDCARPGTARFPLDSAEASDSPRMHRHWKLDVK